MTGLAIPNTDVSDAEATVRMLRSWETLLVDATQEQCEDAADKARVIREVVKIRKLAAEVRVAAVRVEAVCFRRLHQLGAVGRNGSKHIQRWLGEMDDPTFAIILDRLATFQTLHTLKREVEREDGMTSWREGIQSGESPTDSVDGRHLRYGAAIVLKQLSNHTFTVAEAADQLLEDLGCEQNDLNDLAAREVVRAALMTPDDDFDDRFPPFITFATDGGFLRIPWRLATVEQLRWMASYRKQQVADLAEQAEYLDGAAAWAEERAAANGQPVTATLAAVRYPKDVAA